MISASIQEIQQKPSAAQLYLARITAILNSYDQQYSSVERPQAAVLIRLKSQLTAAAAAYEQAKQTHAPHEVCLALQADLLWQCNQCDYYLDHRPLPQLGQRQNQNQRPQAARPATPQNPGLWQIRQATHAAFHFKLLTYIRKIMPGADTHGLAWRDIVPGLKLQILAFLRGH